MTLRVGVVGTGAMGIGVVRSLCRHGVATFTRDLADARNAQAAALGATVCDSPASVARAVDIAIVLVLDEHEVDDVLFANDGLAGAMPANGIVVLSSTVDPHYVETLCMRLAAHDVVLVDAPVSGGPAKAAAGTMTMMVAAHHDACERCAPVLERIAGRVFVVGDMPGQAATFKIVNNLLAAVNLAAAAEAIALARRAGIDPARALEVIDASSGQSWIASERMPRALAGDRTVHAAMRVLAKDVGIAVTLMERLGGESRLARDALRAFREACEAGYADEDDSAMLTWVEGRAGIDAPLSPRGGATRK